MRISTTWIAASLLAVLAAGCSGGGGPTAIEIAIDEIVIIQECPVMAPQEQCQLQAQAFAESGQRITNPVLRWGSFHLDVAEVSEAGLVTAKAPGVATIQVANSTGSVSAQTEVRVIAPSPK